MAPVDPPPPPDRRAAALAHAAMAGAPVVAALVLARTDGRTDAFVRVHAEEALGFQLLALLGLLVGVLLTPVTIGWLLLPAVAVLAAVQSAFAARAALQGRTYRYPVSLRRSRST